MKENKEIIEKIHSVKNWAHRIRMPNGIITLGEWSYNSLEAFDLLPEDLLGKTVLDVRALDGEISFLAEEAGASRVVAMDIYECFDDKIDKDW